MKPIKSVVIGSDVIRVETVPRFKHLGQWDQSAKVITIRARMARWNRNSTILHESLHAISDFHNLCLTEEQVAGLEPALRNLIRNNPQLVKALCET